MKMGKLATFLLCFVITGNAQADVICPGTVNTLRLWGNSTSWAAISLNEYPGTTWIICDTDNQYGGVAPKSCNAMYSTALMAFAANKKITLHFSDYVSCADVPSWDINLPSKFTMLNITN